MEDSSKVYWVANAQIRVIKIMVTNGTKTNCRVSFSLIRDVKTDILIVNRTYGIDNIVEYTKNDGIEIVVPLKSNGKLKRSLTILYIFVTTLLKTLFLLLNIGVTLLLAILKLLLILFILFLFLLFPSSFLPLYFIFDLLFM